MRLPIVVIGVLVLLIGMGWVGYAETSYQSKMNELWEMRGELSELRALAEEKYIETGDPKYLHTLEKIEGLYSETFYMEAQQKTLRSQAHVGSAFFIFAGLGALILGIVLEEKKSR